MSIKLYSTQTCPKCKMLRAKMDKKGLQYEENHNIEEMKSLGILSVPVLEVDGVRYDFVEANKWVNGVVDEH